MSRKTDTADLFAAASCGEIDKVTELIRARGNVNAACRDGFTVLMAASYNDGFEIAAFLIENGSNVNVAARTGETALMHAAKKGTVRITELLLENGAETRPVTNASYVNGGGINALMFAATHEKPDLCRKLIEFGSSLDSQDKRGETALMRASFSGNIETVRTLLELGADPSIRNENDESAFDLAQSIGQTRIAEILKNHKRSQ